MDLTLDVEDYKLNIRSAGVIIHNNKILTHKNVNKNHYSLPGGRVEIGENSEETVIRELHEELEKNTVITGDIATIDFVEDKERFEKLGMTIQREVGEAPTRQLWFNEGIQLKEVSSLEYGTNVDHIALGTKDIEGAIKIALSNGCKLDSRGNNWFILSNGTKIELMEEE